MHRISPRFGVRRETLYQAEMSGTQGAPAGQSEAACSPDLHSSNQRVFPINLEFKVVSVKCTEESYFCQIEYCNGSIAKCPDYVFPCINSETYGYYGVCESFKSYSEPPYGKDTSLRDGLLIFFFLVLPVVILTAVAVVKRDAIKRKLCRKSRGQHRDNNGQQPNQSNGASHDTGNNQPAPSRPSIFTTLHFPGTRQQVQTQLPVVSVGTPMTPSPSDTKVKCFLGTRNQFGQVTGLKNKLKDFNPPVLSLCSPNAFGKHIPLGRTGCQETLNTDPAGCVCASSTSQLSFINQKPEAQPAQD